MEFGYVFNEEECTPTEVARIWLTLGRAADSTVLHAALKRTRSDVLAHSDSSMSISSCEVNDDKNCE